MVSRPARDRSLLQEEIRQRRPFKSVGQEATLAVLRTADVLRSRLAQVVEPMGITLQQYNVLRILRGAHPEPLATLEVGDRMVERTPGVTRLLDRLERKGWVRRARCREDRRRVHCWITREGLELLEGLDPAVDAADERVVGALDDRELVRLVELLEKLRRE